MNQIQIIDLFKTMTYKSYCKFGTIQFAIATHDQPVDTIINGQLETTNTAKQGDYVVVGASGECYVLTPDNFKNKYKISDLQEDQTGTAEVKGEPRYAVQWSGDTFSFVASWGQSMICNHGDYLVSDTSFSEVYRIEQDVFLKTYKIC